jgi:Thoeris protein ThsB, TIR-like domain
MAHRAFFSFHYEKDVWRAGVVRNSDVTKNDVDAEWIDGSIWEEAKKQGDAAVRSLIDGALVGTSVTVVLIGSETASRKWVQYEIEQSVERGNGLLGIYIHNIKDKDGLTTTRGENPLPAGYETYDWINNDGYNNLGSWVDTAYDEAH